MRIIAMLLLCSLSFGNYNSENFDMLGKTISVPPPIWMDNELNGPDVDFKEYGDERYKLYQFIPDNESWDDFSKMLSIIVAKNDKIYPFISYVEEISRDYGMRCEAGILTTVPHLVDNEAIIISACGRLSGELDSSVANKGYIAITYFSIREDIRIIVASEFIVEPFSPIFVNDWPISVPTLKEAAARMLAVTVVKD